MMRTAQRPGRPPVLVAVRCRLARYAGHSPGARLAVLIASNRTDYRLLIGRIGRLMADLLADRNDSFYARHASPRWALREGLGSVSQDFRRFGWPISSGEVAGASWFHLVGTRRFSSSNQPWTTTICPAAPPSRATGAVRMNR